MISRDRLRQWVSATACALLIAMTGCGDEDPGSGPQTDTQTGKVETDTDVSDAPITDPDGTDPDVDGSEPDVDEVEAPDTRDGEAPETDERDGESRETDAGPTCDEDLDCDNDGLNNCEELELGTEKCDDDSDDDGLLDLQEIERGTDPLDDDTDNDGATDGEEVEQGLDPLKPSTFGDGVSDGERWRLTACEDPQAEPVNYYENRNGNWLLALPPAYDSYETLDIDSASQQNLHAIAVYDDPASEVAGTLLSDQPETSSSSETDPVDVVVTRRESLEGMSTIEQDFSSGSFETHDGRDASLGQYLVEIPDAMSVRAFRNKLVKEFTEIPLDKVSGLPSTEGAKHTHFRVYVSVILRNYGGAIGEQTLTSVSIAPNNKFENRDQIKFRMDDLTNTTNIAERSDRNALRCRMFEPEQEPKTDFYWVLDQSGSMSDDYERVRAVANDFYSQLNRSALDYRLGVTSMYEGDEGHIRPNNGWGTSISGFLSDITWVENRCEELGFGSGCGSEEYGLKVAKKGVEYMNTAAARQNGDGFRPDANVITIFMSDEESQTAQDSGVSATSNYRNYLSQHTTSFAIVSDSEDCGTTIGASYQQAALDTGGSHASLCAENINETIEDIIIAAVGYAANYELPGTPISSTLRVYINGDWIPRSRTNGFDYFAQTNSISFFGDVLPKPPTEDSNQPGDFIAISYESMLDVTKNCPGGRNQETGQCAAQGGGDEGESDSESDSGNGGG